MMFAVAPIISFLLAAAISVRADPTPTEPAPGNVFIEGQNCTIAWNADPTGVWTTMDIELMTGDNFNMVYLTTVGTVDGTTQTTYSYPCPKVTPHSAIYFYQFTSPASTVKTWTGRFVITDNANDIVPPTQSTQPNGQAIPWGTGALVNGTSTVAPSSGSIAPSSSVPIVTKSASTASSTPTISAGSPLLSPVTTMVYITSSVPMPSATASALPKANSASATLSVSGIFRQTALALGLSAIGFAVMF